MSPRLTGATALRALRQIRRDHRTIALILVVPVVLITLLWWMFQDLPVPPGQAPVFDSVGPRLMGLFPLIMMFLITSVTTLRERTGGTLERLMTMPVGKADLVFGYAAAFSLVAAVQGVVLVVYSVFVLGMDFAGPLWALMLIIVLDAVLGTALGLAASSLARTEFQAVQMMPAVILPQLLLAGLIIDRSAMPTALEWVSNALPLSYAIDAINTLARESSAGGIGGEVAVLAAFIAAALALGVATLRRRTP